MKEIKIGDEIDFVYYGVAKSGVVADVNDTQVFVRIPSSQILIIRKEEVL